MSTITTSTEYHSPLLAVASFLRPFTVDEYHRLLSAGILYHGEALELLEGFIVNKYGPVTAEPPSLLSISGFRRFTPEEYHKMIDAGILIEGEPVELLEGYLVLKMGRNTPHEASLRRMTTRMPSKLPSGWFIQIQGAITLSESEPEPDGAILRGADEDYDKRLPVSGDIGIVIEVSDSSLLLDRREKGRLYSRNAIPVYWVLNVVDRQIEVYTDPDPAANPPRYRSRKDYLPGDSVPIVLNGQAVANIPVSDLIP